LMLQGIPPYKLAYNMKFPGTYAAYAVIMAVFGETPAGIHIGLICLSSATALMLYWLGRKLVDEVVGVVAATASAFLFASPSMLGLAGHATHFVAFFVTAALCVLLPGQRARKISSVVLGGFLLGMAVMMKQQAAIFCIWGALMVTLPVFQFRDEPW